MCHIYKETEYHVKKDVGGYNFLAYMEDLLIFQPRNSPNFVRLIYFVDISFFDSFKHSQNTISKVIYHLYIIIMISMSSSYLL